MEKRKVDARDIRCPGPFLQIAKIIDEIQAGEIFVVEATDPAFKPDLEVWCRRMGHRLVRCEENHEGILALIQRAA